MAVELKGISFVLDENPVEVRGLIRAETSETVFVAENHRIVFTDKRAYIVNGNHEHLSVMWRSVNIYVVSAESSLYQVKVQLSTGFDTITFWVETNTPEATAEEINSTITWHIYNDCGDV